MIPEKDQGCGKDNDEITNFNNPHSTLCTTGPDLMLTTVPTEPTQVPPVPTPVPLGPTEPTPVPPVPPLQDRNQRVIIASDVEALYPSLDIKSVKKTVFKLRSGFKISTTEMWQNTLRCVPSLGRFAYGNYMTLSPLRTPTKDPNQQ